MAAKFHYILLIGIHQTNVQGATSKCCLAVYVPLFQTEGSEGAILSPDFYSGAEAPATGRGPDGEGGGNIKVVNRKCDRGREEGIYRVGRRRRRNNARHGTIFGKDPLLSEIRSGKGAG